LDIQSLYSLPCPLKPFNFKSETLAEKSIILFQVKEFGFRDSWQQVGCPEPIKTCRFDTHIDYVYANDQILSKYKVEHVLHVDDPASDHNLVKATFGKK
jgi:hypothetical protein